MPLPSGYTLDKSNSAPASKLPAGYTLDAPNAQAEQPSAVSRLASSFIDNTPIGAAVNLGKDYIQHNSQNTANGDGLLSGFHALGQTIWDVSNGITNSTVNAAQKTAAAAKAGDIRKVIQQAPGMVPLVGPAAVHAGEQVDAGDYAGAAGTSLGLVGSAAAPHIVKAAAPVVDSASDLASRVMTNSKTAIPAASKSAVQGAIATLKGVKAAGMLNVPAVLKAAQTIKAAGGDIVTTLGNILGPTSLEKATITDPALAELVADRNMAVQMGVNDLQQKLKGSQADAQTVQPVQPIQATRYPSGRAPGGIENQQKAAELRDALDFANKATLAESRAAWEARKAKVASDVQSSGIQKAGDSPTGDLVTNVRSPITLPSGRKIGGFNNQSLAPDTHSILTIAATENDGAALKALPADAKAALVDAVKKGDNEKVQSILNSKPNGTAAPAVAADGAPAELSLTQAQLDALHPDIRAAVVKRITDTKNKVSVIANYLKDNPVDPTTGASNIEEFVKGDSSARQALADAAIAHARQNGLSDLLADGLKTKGKYRGVKDYMVDMVKQQLNETPKAAAEAAPVTPEPVAAAPAKSVEQAAPVTEWFIGSKKVPITKVAPGTLQKNLKMSQEMFSQNNKIAGFSNSYAGQLEKAKIQEMQAVMKQRGLKPSFGLLDFAD